MDRVIVIVPGGSILDPGSCPYRSWLNKEKLSIRIGHIASIIDAHTLVGSSPGLTQHFENYHSMFNKGHPVLRQVTSRLLFKRNHASRANTCSLTYSKWEGCRKENGFVS